MELRKSPRKSFLLCDLQRNRNQKNLQLSDIISHVVEFVCDVNGSKFVQQKLRDATEHRKDLVYNEMKPFLLLLIKDKFANFVVQRFYEIAAYEQRQQILHCVCDNLYDISFNIYGCRVVQTIIELSSFEDKLQILSKLFGNVRLFSRDQHAHHIVIKFLQMHPDKNNLNFILNEFQYNIAIECRNQYSCRVIQQLLETGTDQQKEILLREIAEDVITIVEDRYGNYVIQSVLRYIAENQSSASGSAYNIVARLYDMFWQLAQNKYASNVAEKLLNQDLANIIFEQLMQFSDEQLTALCKHQYANYIIQKLVHYLSISQRLRLLEHIGRYQGMIQRHLGGRKIIGALKIPSKITFTP